MFRYLDKNRNIKIVILYCCGQMVNLHFKKTIPRGQASMYHGTYVSVKIHCIYTETSKKLKNSQLYPPNIYLN